MSTRRRQSILFVCRIAALALVPAIALCGCGSVAVDRSGTSSEGHSKELPIDVPLIGLLEDAPAKSLMTITKTETPEEFDKMICDMMNQRYKGEKDRRNFLLSVFVLNIGHLHSTGNPTERSSEENCIEGVRLEREILGRTHEYPLYFSNDFYSNPLAKPGEMGIELGWNADDIMNKALEWCKKDFKEITINSLIYKEDLEVVWRDECDSLQNRRAVE